MQVSASFAYYLASESSLEYFLVRWLCKLPFADYRTPYDKPTQLVLAVVAAEARE